MDHITKETKGYDAAGNVVRVPITTHVGVMTAFLGHWTWYSRKLRGAVYMERQREYEADARYYTSD